MNEFAEERDPNVLFDPIFFLSECWSYGVR